MNTKQPARILGGKSVSEVFKNAERHGHFTEWTRGSALYDNFVNEASLSLITGHRTKPKELVKTSSRVVGWAYDKYPKQPLVHDFACDVVNAMSENLSKSWLVRKLAR